MAEVRISPQDERTSQAALQVGDVLAVELPENATTGYVWSVAAVPGVLGELPGERAGAELDEGPRPGAAGRRVLRFAAERPGTGELALRHGRPWQPDGGDELTIPITVESGS